MWGVTWGCPLPVTTHRRPFCFNEFSARSPLGYFRIGANSEGSKIRLARAFQATTSTELPNGDILFERHDIVDDWTRVRNRWTLMRSGATRTFEFTHRIYSGQEMKDLLTSAGLADVRLYGDLDGGSYGFEAKRLIAIARRSIILKR